MRCMNLNVRITDFPSSALPHSTQYSTPTHLLDRTVNFLMHEINFLTITYFNLHVDKFKIS